MFRRRLVLSLSAAWRTPGEQSSVTEWGEAGRWTRPLATQPSLPTRAGGREEAKRQKAWRAFAFAFSPVCAVPRPSSRSPLPARSSPPCPSALPLPPARRAGWRGGRRGVARRGAARHRSPRGRPAVCSQWRWRRKKKRETSGQAGRPSPKPARPKPNQSQAQAAKSVSSCSSGRPAVRVKSKSAPSRRVSAASAVQCLRRDAQQREARRAVHSAVEWPAGAAQRWRRGRAQDHDGEAAAAKAARGCPRLVVR